MNTNRNLIDNNTYYAMLTKWRDHMDDKDFFITMREYYVNSGWDVQYDTHFDRWTIPTSQLTFFLLSL